METQSSFRLNCPVCHTKFDDGKEICIVCGIEDKYGVVAIWITLDDAREWYEVIVSPARRYFDLHKQNQLLATKYAEMEEHFQTKLVQQRIDAQQLKSLIDNYVQADANKNDELSLIEKRLNQNNDLIEKFRYQIEQLRSELTNKDIANNKTVLEMQVSLKKQDALISSLRTQLSQQNVSFYNGTSPQTMLKSNKRDSIITQINTRVHKLLGRTIKPSIDESKETFAKCAIELAHNSIDPSATHSSLWQGTMSRVRSDMAEKVNCSGRIITPKIGDIVEFGFFSWRVINVQEGMALFLSDKVLERRVYHEQKTSVTWEKCTLRQYLSTSFYDNFSLTEKSLILQTNLINAKNPWFGTDGGQGTPDKIFLLSIEEVRDYFGGDLSVDDYNYYDYGSDNGWENDKERNNLRKATDINGLDSWWWLRSPGSDSRLVASIGTNGGIYQFGYLAHFIGHQRGGGVRPAMWVRIEGSENENDGSLSNM